MSSRYYKGDTCKECGKPITIKNKSGKCRACFMVGNKRCVGRKLTKSQIEKLKKRKGNKNPNWKGKEAVPSSIHGWVKNNFEKPEKCEICKKRKGIDWSNKDHRYKRKRDDWQYTCRPCHMAYDIKKGIRKYEYSQS